MKDITLNITIKEISISIDDIYSSTEMSKAGFYKNITDNNIYFTDTQSVRWTLGDSNNFINSFSNPTTANSNDTFVETLNNIETDKANPSNLTESFVLKMLAVSRGSVKDVEL